MKARYIAYPLLASVGSTACLLLCAQNIHAADWAASTGMSGDISSAVLTVSTSAPPEIRSQTWRSWLALFRDGALWFHNGTAFQPYQVAAEPPPAIAAATGSKTQLTLPASDLRGFGGAEFYIGMGSSFTEMLQASRYTMTGRLVPLAGICKAQSLTQGVAVQGRLDDSTCKSADGKLLGSLYRFAGTAGQTVSFSYQGSGMGATVQLRAGNDLALLTAEVPSGEPRLMTTDLTLPIYNWSATLPQTGTYDVFVAGSPSGLQFCSGSIGCLRTFNGLRYEVKLTSVSGGTQAADAQRGGMDLVGYCKFKGYNTATTVGTDVNSWKCVDAGGGLYPIDVADVCSVQYKGALPYAAFSNFGDSSSWYCTNVSP